MTRLYLVIHHDRMYAGVKPVTADEATIGRTRACDIILSSVLVSRTHAKLVKSEAGYLIHDLGSRNGTQVDGRRVREAELLKPGAEIVIGPFQLRVCPSLDEAVRHAGITNDSTSLNRVLPADTTDLEARIERLTPAQRRVYHYFLQGLLEKEVAVRLSITVHTVHGHAKEIYKKLGVSTRGELIAQWAARPGLPAIDPTRKTQDAAR